MTPRTNNRFLGGNCASRGLRFASAILAATGTQRGRCGDTSRGPRESYARPRIARRDNAKHKYGRRARRGRCFGRGGSLGSLGSLVSIGSKAWTAAKRETKHRGKTANPATRLLAHPSGDRVAVGYPRCARLGGKTRQNRNRARHFRIGARHLAARSGQETASPLFAARWGHRALPDRATRRRHDARARRVRLAAADRGALGGWRRRLRPAMVNAYR